jgi:hypothetical protein
MGWCKYFSQEMRQQFGGSIAGIGGPSLDLSFMGAALDPRITFTRTTTATYTDATGLVRTAAINEPRWDYAGGVMRGLLIEEARTNLVSQSGNLANVAWGTAGNVAAAPAVTANQTTAPDGTLTAARLVSPAVSGAGAYSILFQSFAGTAAPYSYSTWLKGSAGGEQLYLCTTDNTLHYTAPRITLTTAWQRFTFVTPTLSAAGWYFVLGTDLRDGGQTSTSAQTIYAWGAQAEQGAFATSYIPTISVVTRAQDNCVISGANTVGWFVSPGGSWFAEFFPYSDGAGSNKRIVGVVAGGAAIMFVNPASITGQYDGVAVENPTGNVAANTMTRCVMTWAPGQAKGSLNAGPVDASALLTTGYGAVTASGVSFMGTSAAAEVMSGYIRRVQYWPRALSNAEMQGITT